MVCEVCGEETKEYAFTGKDGAERKGTYKRCRECRDTLLPTHWECGYAECKRHVNKKYAMCWTHKDVVVLHSCVDCGTTFPGKYTAAMRANGARCLVCFRAVSQQRHAAALAALSLIARA